MSLAVFKETVLQAVIFAVMFKIVYGILDLLLLGLITFAKG